MNILYVSAMDTGGGAHKVGSALHQGLRARGHRTAMAVGTRMSSDPDVLAIPVGISGPRWFAQRAAARALRPVARRVPPLQLLRRALRSPRPIGYLRARAAGREFFGYPGSHAILDLPPFEPDIVHLHNLHSWYFDLRFLTALSAQVPVTMTLHDEWTFTGHCAYSLVGDRWRDGCRSCPDLDIHPAIHRDGTHANWLAKRAIYRASRLYVSAPSRWLLERAQQSILASGVVDWRLIPNGVDQRYFRPADRLAARQMLGLPPEPLILLFTANALNRNPFKDYATVARAVELVAGQLQDRQLLLIALGGEGPARHLGNAELRFVPYEMLPERVAAYYQAADLYLHAAHADTFPTTILEALAVGRPVVATAVGGIDEQVRSLSGVPGAWSGIGVDEVSATGVLVPAHDASAMAAATTRILADDGLRGRLSKNAADDAAERFTLERQLDATLAWYADVREDWRRWHGSAA